MRRGPAAGYHRGRLRTCVSIASIAAVLAAAPAARATPTSVLYNDFARDGVLRCTYSRADLKAALGDASVYQYGDPYTITGLRLAIRKQLAGSCDGTADDGGSSGRMLVAAGGALVVVLGVAGWAARRAFAARR